MLVEVGDAPFARAGAFVVVAEQQPALELATDAAQRGAGEDAFRCAARAHVDVDGRVGIGGGDDAGDVAVTDQHHADAKAAQLGDQRFVARAVEDAGDDLVGSHALGRGDRLDILGRRLVEIDDAGGQARADRDLVHINVGRVEQAARFGDGEHREAVRTGLGADRRAFQRIERDVDRRAVAAADLFPDEQHRRLVALALADHDGAVDVEFVERSAHRLDRRGVRRLFVAAPG